MIVKSGLQIYDAKPQWQEPECRYNPHSGCPRFRMISRSKAPFLLIAVAALIAILASLVPPMPQPQDYHNFADHRGWLGIPNFA